MRKNISLVDEDIIILKGDIFSRDESKSTFPIDILCVLTLIRFYLYYIFHLYYILYNWLFVFI